MYEPTRRDKKLYKDMNVCVMVPFTNYYAHTGFIKSLANMICYSWMHGLKVYQMGMTERTVIDWARGLLGDAGREKLNEYTNEPFTHLLWLDDDHMFNPDLLVKLATHDKDMVSALYYGRTEPHLPVVYVKDETDNKYRHYPMYICPEALFKCDAVGFGALLMRRDVLDRVPKPWFTLDWKSGEDIAFCVHAKEHGVEIYCDGTYKLGHFAPPKVITEKDFTRYVEQHPEEFGDRVKVDLEK